MTNWAITPGSISSKLRTASRPFLFLAVKKHKYMICFCSIFFVILLLRNQEQEGFPSV